MSFFQKLFGERNFSESVEEKYSKAMISIPSNWVIGDWFLDINKYFWEDNRNADGRKKISSKVTIVVKDRIENKYFQNNKELEVIIVMYICRLNLSDADYIRCVHLIDKWWVAGDIRSEIRDEWEDFFLAAYTREQDRLPPSPYMSI